MDIVLNDSEVRILACLMEKEMTTPEYYPLSLNSLSKTPSRDWGNMILLSRSRCRGKPEEKSAGICIFFLGGIETLHNFSAEPAALQMSSQERIEKLEEEIVRLRSELEELKRAFAEFKSQF